MILGASPAPLAALAASIYIYTGLQSIFMVGPTIKVNLENSKVCSI
jgi:hypothetical protein